MLLTGLSQTLSHWVAASFSWCSQPPPSPFTGFLQRNTGLALEIGVLVNWGQVIRQAVRILSVFFYETLPSHFMSDVNFILFFSCVYFMYL